MACSRINSNGTLSGMNRCVQRVDKCDAKTLTPYGLSVLIREDRVAGPFSYQVVVSYAACLDVYACGIV